MRRGRETLREPTAAHAARKASIRCGETLRYAGGSSCIAPARVAGAPTARTRPPQHARAQDCGALAPLAQGLQDPRSRRRSPTTRPSSGRPEVVDSCGKSRSASYRASPTCKRLLLASSSRLFLGYDEVCLRARLEQSDWRESSLQVLRKLSATPCTRNLLDTTRIGVTIGHLCKHPDYEVQDLAGRIVKVWKAQLAEHETYQAAARRRCTR